MRSDSRIQLPEEVADGGLFLWTWNINILISHQIRIQIDLASWLPIFFPIFSKRI
jgi:hypothetical protein